MDMENLPVLNSEHPIDPSIRTEIEATLSRIQNEFQVPRNRSRAIA